MSDELIATSERDRFTRSPAPWVAGTSDVGKKHHLNQDALCIAAREQPSRAAVIAVSDGVTTAPRSEVASLVASDTAVKVLTEALRDGSATGELFVKAFEAAHQAVVAAAEGDEPSACTLIAGIMQTGSIIVGNIGDSRAYWLADDGSAVLLSTDDSMAQARIMLGMSREDAEQSAQAHSITKWLGRGAENVVPSVMDFQPDSNGWLLLCSDGLWNYASDPEEMHALVQHVVSRHHSPESITEALIDWANQQGGRDNITAALARYEA